MKKYELTTQKMEELFACWKQLRDPELKRQTWEVWRELYSQCSWNTLEEIPFGLDNKRFSLVEHINGATESALAAASALERIHGLQYNHDIIIVLGLLHDCSKIVEIEPDGEGGAQMSEIGLKIQHGAYGAMCAYQKGMSIDIAHLILTHTPKFSVMTPQVYLNEAHLFVNVDLCDADALQIAAGCKPVFP